MTLQTINFTASTAAHDFTQSLKEFGFAVLSHHPLDNQKINLVYRDWEGFFRSEEKHHYLFRREEQDGFFPHGETAKGETVADLKEFYHLYPWGRMPNSISSSTTEIFHSMEQLAITLLEWVETHTPKSVQLQFKEPLSQMHVDSPNTLLRILHYPPLTGQEPSGAIRAAAHEDINLLTILPSATATGLQVKTKQQTWLDIPCDPGNLIINCGDMLQEVTQHHYKATTHRVINPDGEAAKQSRLSMPLFLHPRDDVFLSEKYPRAVDYRIERLKELGIY